MAGMPMSQRQYPVGYQVSGVFDDATDALEAIRYVQAHDRESHLAIDTLQRWIPAYAEESPRHILHKFDMDQATATSKELLSRIHEPYVSPYIARRIAIEIRFDEAKNDAQHYVGYNGQPWIPASMIDIQEADLDPLKEFLEKFDDVERATVKWFPKVCSQVSFLRYRDPASTILGLRFNPLNQRSIAIKLWRVTKIHLPGIYRYRSQKGKLKSEIYIRNLRNQ